MGYRERRWREMQVRYCGNVVVGERGKREKKDCWRKGERGLERR